LRVEKAKEKNQGVSRGGGGVLFFLGSNEKKSRKKKSPKGAPYVTKTTPEAGGKTRKYRENVFPFLCQKRKKSRSALEEENVRPAKRTRGGV